MTWRPRPLYALCAALAGGVWIGAYVPIPAAFLLAAMALLVVAILLLPLRKHTGLVAGLSLGALLLLGMVRAQQSVVPAPDDVCRFATGAPATLIGTTDAEPATRRQRFGRATSSLTLTAQSIEVRGVAQPVSGRVSVVLLSTPYSPAPFSLRREKGEHSDPKANPFVPRRLVADDAPVIHAGDLLRLRGRLDLPAPASNPGGFDEAAYLQERGIASVLFVTEHGRSANADGGAVAVVSRTAEHGGETLSERIDAEMAARLSPENAALVHAILTGDRSGLDYSTATALARTGTLHLVAFSGLHVALIAGLALWLLRRLTVPHKIAHVVALVVVWAFAAGATGQDGIHTPALRAALVASVFLVAPLLRRVPEPRHSLVFAALVMLLLDPRALWSLGAQLTFAVVGALIWWMPPLERLLWPWEPNMPAVSRVTRPVLLTVIGAVVAQIAASPLSAYAFHQVSLVAPLANLILAPLASALLVATLTTATLPALPLWGALGYGLDAFRTLVVVFAAPDWAAVSAAAPPTVAVALCYAALFGGGAALRARIMTPRRFFGSALRNGILRH